MLSVRIDRLLLHLLKLSTAIQHLLLLLLRRLLLRLVLLLLTRLLQLLLLLRLLLRLYMLLRLGSLLSQTSRDVAILLRTGNVEMSDEPQTLLEFRAQIPNYVLHLGFDGITREHVFYMIEEVHDVVHVT